MAANPAAPALAAVPGAAPAERTAVPVEVRQVDGRRVLLRSGKPYFVNGAGGSDNLELLAASGGNPKWGLGGAGWGRGGCAGQR